MPVVNYVIISLFCGAAAIGVIVLGALVEAEGRSAPALVHPASGDVNGWVVDAPATGIQAGGEAATFIGIRSLLNALEHVHTTYGSVTYLSR